MDEFQKIFEFEIRTKLSRRCRTKNEEIRLLYNSFRFYDFGSSSIIDKSSWIKGIQKTGLCGFNISDLSDLFSRYDKNNTGFINYRNFTFYIYGKEELLPLSKEYIDDNLNKLLENNKSKITTPLVEFKPPGLYDRSFEIMIDNEKRFNKINNKVNNMQKIVEEEKNEKINNYINRTPFIKRNKSNLSNISDLSIQNYSLFFENETKYKKLLEYFKSKININNGITYYTLMKELSYYQNQNDKTINLKTLYFVLRQLKIDFKFYDLIELFKYLDRSNKETIKVEELLKIIRGNIDTKRKAVIQNVFDMNDKNKLGKISIDEIKSLYNCKMHPDVYVGFKKEDECYKEFCYTFDIFCNFYEIYRYITCEQLVDYYTGISASIFDDNYFDDILNGVWNINIVSNKDMNSNINIDSTINNKNYKDIYKKELMGSKINTNNNYILNKRYVNDPSKNKVLFNYVNSSLNLNKEEEKQNPNLSSYTPIPRINDQNFEKITPYNTPIKTPLYKGIKNFRNYRHNPITNEITINRENSKENKYYEEMMRYKYNKISSVIAKLRDLIIARGRKGIFNFQKLFCLYDKEKTGQITYIKFIELCEIYNINLDRKNLKDIFEFYDKEKIGRMKYDELIQELIKNISIDRAILVKSIYNDFDKDKYGNIFINDIRKRFKAINHPYVRKGIKSEQEIYFEFLECLNIFRIYKCCVKNLNNIDLLNYGGFLEFFKEISLSIKNDKLFEEIIYCFNTNIVYEE